MKLKLTADPKKWMLFGLYCIFALYFVAIAVLNLSYFSHYGIAWGINPLPAFGPDYLMATIFGFVAVIIASFLGVSNYFFEKEKGIGLSTAPKKEKGYSRWETEKEFKKNLSPVNPSDEKIDKAGIPLINDGKTIWVDSGEYHNLIIGSTGSGKTQIIIQPMVKVLAKKGESMIITDPKGEIYEKNAEELKEKGYNVVLLNFRNPQNGNSWNPLTLPYQLYKEGNKDKATELLNDLAANILYDENAQNQDPFWEKTSADYFTALALGLFEDAKEDEININSINLMSTVGENKIGPTTYIKEYFTAKGQDSIAYMNASSTISAPNDTKQSILSVFHQKIMLFSSKENLSEMLSRSDFDMKDIGRKKTAVFLVIHDEKKTYHSLATIFLKQCYETLIDVAQENGGKLEYKTNFMLDEFANMPPLKDVTTMVTAARSRAIRFTFIIQNFAQLSQVYGKENGDTIKGNCGNIIYLISSEMAALEEISKMCGEVKSKEKDKTASTPLVTVSDLQRLPEGTIIILRVRTMPFKTKMKFNWQMENENAWGKKYPKAGYPQREKQPVSLFDIKAFMDSKRDENINNLLAGMGRGGAPMPGIPGLPGMPGMPSQSPRSNPDRTKDINDFFKELDAKMNERMKSPTSSKPTLFSESAVESNKPVTQPEPPKGSSNGSLTDAERDSIRATVRAAMARENASQLSQNSDVIKADVAKPVDSKKEAVKEEQTSAKPVEKLETPKAESTKVEKVPEVKEEPPKKVELPKIPEFEVEEKVVEEPKVEVKPEPVVDPEKEKRDAELKAFEEKRKKQEEELQKAIETSAPVETKGTYEASDEARHQITEDEFFDDFFNDDY